MVGHAFGRLYGEVARLVEEELGAASCHVGGLERVTQHEAVVEVSETHFHVIDKLGQERGSARCRPEIAEFLCVKGVDKTERVVDVGHVAAAEMVAVVVVLQLLVGLGLRPSVGFAHCPYFLSEVLG